EASFPQEARPQVDVAEHILDPAVHGVASPNHVRVPEGFLRPGYFPDGISKIETYSSSMVIQFWMSLPYESAALVMERFRFGGLPAQLRTGTRVLINGNEGFLTR